MRTPEQRFWRRVERRGDAECWTWHGTRGYRGYGQIRIDGKLVYAHRLAFTLANGPIPDGMCVLHRCDNPPCVNPAHLFLGTYADNNRDMREKNRDRTGRLGYSAAEEIRSRYARGGVTHKELAREFGVSSATVCLVVNRKVWTRERVST